jgi:hypothetical protein
MFIRTKSRIRVPAGALLGLTLKQFDARAHLIKLEYVDCGCEQFVVEARESLEFKAGEEFWVESVPKDWAGQVTVLDDETNTTASEARITGEASAEGTAGAEASGAAAAAPANAASTNAEGPGSNGPADEDTDSAGDSAGSAERTAASSGQDAQEAAGAGELAPARPGKPKAKS